MPDPLKKRPNYFQAQFLLVRDFQDEQAYHEEMLRRHNRLMHDWGVVRDGLRVTQDGGDYKIDIGSAIDSLGREIVLEKPGNLTAADLIAARAVQGSEPNISITITFDESKSDVPLDNYPPPGGKDNVTRMMQKPQIAFTKSPAATDVVLARVKPDGTVDYSTRKLAGSFVRGSGSSDLCISTEGKVGIGTKSPGFPLQVGSTDVVGTWKLCVAGKGSTGNFRQWTLRTGDGDNELDIHKFRIRDEQGTADRLTIDQNGNVGIGTTAPKDQLQIGAGYSTIAISPMPADTPGTMFTNDYGSAYLGFNAVRTSTGKWRRETKSGTLNGGSMIYGTVEGKLCFVTLEPALAQDFEFTDIAARRRMVIDATGNVSIAKDLTVARLFTSEIRLRGSDINHGINYFGEGASDQVGDFAIDGPVVYGFHGGALGCSSGNNKTNKRVVLRWDDHGNVGIGTTGVPAAKLHLGSGTLQIGTTDTSVTTIDSAITHKFGDETNPRYTIDRDLLGNGQSGIGFNMRKVPSATLAANGSAVGIPTDRTLAFSTSDGSKLVERVRIDSAGNVGIGTPDATARLTVRAVIKYATLGGPWPVQTLAGDNNVYSLDNVPNFGSVRIGDLVKIGDETRTVREAYPARLRVDPPFRSNQSLLPLTVVRVSSEDILRADDQAGNSALFVSGDGNVGIGNQSPPFKLSTKDSDTIATGVLRLQNSYNGLNNDYSAGYGIELAGIDNGTNGHDLRIRGRTSATGGFSDLVIVKNNGNVGIGTTTPKARLDVGDMSVGIKSILARQGEGNNDKEPGTCIAVTSYSTQGTTSFAIEHYFYGQRNGYINFCRGGGAGDGFVNFGRGKDLAELFKSAEQVVPGDVVVFEAQDNVVKCCEREADTCVIGIVSGRPGAVLGEEDNNGSPIALCGRVPCNVDADIAPIQSGDLLTTSPTKGHAQKVLDDTKAAGAIIGKALGSLGKGKGQITVLVALA